MANLTIHDYIKDNMTTMIHSMTSMKIAELKAHLSQTIKVVRTGQEVTICDRSLPVAKIVPIAEYRPAQIARAITPFAPVKSTLNVTFDPLKAILSERNRR